jgi:hypothetical protein
MLKRQPDKAMFTGGIESARLQNWHVDLLADIKPKRLYMAYDTEDDYEPLRKAAKMLTEGLTLHRSHNLCCYCLIGYPKDTIEAAEKRLVQCLDLNLTPMAMLYRDDKGNTDPEWRKFQRLWARPAIIHSCSA